MLRRIQELTTEGVSLAGVQKVLALEDELGAAHDRIVALERRLDALVREMEERVAAAHRQYKRELVPLRSAALSPFPSTR